MRTVYLIVSTVGTMISLNMASLDIGAVSLRSSVHDDHFPAPFLVGRKKMRASIRKKALIDNDKPVHMLI